MKHITLIALVLTLALPAQATLMKVTGTFNGAPQNNPPAGPVHLLSGGFTSYFDDALVPTTGNFTFDNLTPVEFFLNNPLIGSTTFDLTNTFLDLNFHNGNLTSFTLGDVTNNLTSAGMDDFSVYFENNGAFLLSQVVITEKTGFFGVDFRFNDPTAGAFSVSVAPPQSVPDFASTGWLAALAGLSLVGFRRIQQVRLLSTAC